MEIKIGNLVLTSEYAASRKIHIIIRKGDEKLVAVDSEILKAAIEALKKSCWWP